MKCPVCNEDIDVSAYSVDQVFDCPNEECQTELVFGNDNKLYENFDGLEEDDDEDEETEEEL
jgi:hypothetical protein